MRLAGSTLPAMVVHAAIDAVSFGLIFLHPDLLPALLTASTLKSGMDAPSWIALSGALLFGTLTIVGFVRMARCRSAEREEATARQLVLEETA